MQYGVRHYLIKPCSCEKMEEVLREAIQEQKHQRQLEAALDKNRILGSKNVRACYERGTVGDDWTGRSWYEKKTKVKTGFTISGQLGEDVQILYVYYLGRGVDSSFRLGNCHRMLYKRQDN